jgi:hypothetical protein
MATLQNGILVLDQDEELHFPVDPGSDLATVQTIRQITSLDDIRDFQFVEEWARAAMGSNIAPGALISNRLDAQALLDHVVAETGGTVVSLQVTDFIVPAGSTTVLHGPLNEINASGAVVVAGKLKFTDHLVISCNEIRGS